MTKQNIGHVRGRSPVTPVGSKPSRQTTSKTALDGLRRPSKGAGPKTGRANAKAAQALLSPKGGAQTQEPSNKVWWSEHTHPEGGYFVKQATVDKLEHAVSTRNHELDRINQEINQSVRELNLVRTRLNGSEGRTNPDLGRQLRELEDRCRTLQGQYAQLSRPDALDGWDR